MAPLIQLAIVWAGVFAASLVASKTRLTSVLYFLAFGALMVNFGILPMETEPFIRGFVDLGTKIVLDWDIFVSIIPQSITLLVGLFFAQIISASMAARYTGNFTFHESMLIGFGMLGRAELAFVVMDIAYIQNNILSTEAFYTLMFTAFWLNVAVPVTITLWKPLYDRALEREAKPG